MGKSILHLDKVKPTKTWSSKFWICTVLIFIALFLSACMVKEKGNATLHRDENTPPWDPDYFSPRILPGTVTKNADTVFNLFKEIEALENEPISQSPEATPGEINDSLRIHQMFDTGFVFPQQPIAFSPYAYDESFRDDTLYRQAYGNGLFTQDHPCASIYILSGRFLHPAKWLRSGLTKQQISEAIGTPQSQKANIFRYVTHYAGIRPVTRPEDSLSTAADYNTFDIFEGISLYFHEDSLFAAALYRSNPCH